MTRGDGLANEALREGSFGPGDEVVQDIGCRAHVADQARDLADEGIGGARIPRRHRRLDARGLRLENQVGG